MEKYRGESFLFYTECIESTGKCNDIKEDPSEVENSRQGAGGYKKEREPSRTLSLSRTIRQMVLLNVLGMGFSIHLEKVLKKQREFKKYLNHTSKVFDIY